jgi:hypothetical protein
MVGAVIALVLAAGSAAWAQEAGADPGATGGTEKTADPSSALKPPALQLLGFADGGFAVTSKNGATTSAFQLGQFDLLFSSTLARDWSVLAEALFEAEANNEFKVDVERIVVQYAPLDAFNVAVGRFHSTIGYYNTAFPHAFWHQVAATRPMAAAFEDEGGVVPAHGVGVSVSGRTGGPLRLRYFLEVSNGLGVEGLGAANVTPTFSVQVSGDQNQHKAVNLALQTRPARAPGWQLGVSAYFDKVGPAGLPLVDERILTGHVVFQDARYEWLNEVVGVHHQGPTAPARNTSVLYSQLSAQVRNLRPFMRYERQSVPVGDPLHPNFAGLVQGPSVGVRLDPTTREAAVRLAQPKRQGCVEAVQRPSGVRVLARSPS